MLTKSINIVITKIKLKDMKKKNLVQLQNSNEEKMLISEDISKYQEIKNTPFTAVMVKSNWRIVMGNEIASAKEFEKIEELENYVESKPWELIVTASSIFQKIVEDNQNKEVKNEK